MKTLPLWLRKELPQILILALPFAAVAAYWDKFPPVIVTHWGIDGRPNGWMSKGVGLLLAPLLNFGVCALLYLAPRLDPKLRADPDAGAIGNRRFLRLARLTLTAFLSLVSLMVAAVALGWSIDVNRVIFNSLLIMLAIVGNFLGNVHPNYVFGIRTPWTLEDPETWRATHRASGRLVVFGALLLLPLQCVVPSGGLHYLLLAFLGVWAAWSLVYSYLHFQRRQPAR